MSGTLRQMLTCHYRARSLWSGRPYVDPAAVDRVRHFLDDITGAGPEGR